MLNENRLYSISLGVASLQDGLVGVATALSPAMAGHFKFLLHHFFVRLGLVFVFVTALLLSERVPKQPACQGVILTTRTLKRSGVTVGRAPIYEQGNFY